MSQDQSKTFFSYAHQDSEFVLRLVNDLRAAGADVWVDQFDITAGQHWDAEIGKALRLCARHVVVLSPAAVESPNVMDELTYALDRNKQVIPLLYRDCEVPYRLGRVQYIDFRRDYATGLRNLLRALSSAVGPALGVRPSAVVTAPLTPGQSTAVSDTGPQPARSETGAQRAPSSQEQPGPQRLQTPLKTPQTAPKTGAGKYWLATAAFVLLAFVIGRIALDGDKKPENAGDHPAVSSTPAGANSSAPQPASPGQDVSTEAKSFYKLGKDYYSKKEFDKAIDALTQAIRLDPHYADAFGMRGEVYEDKGDKDAAVQDFTQALNLNPKDKIAYDDRCRVFHQKGQDDQAIQDCDQALKINPDSADTYHNRAAAYESKGEYDRAIQDYTQAIKLRASNAISYFGRANTYFRKGDYDRAIQDYNASLNLDPNFADAYYGRGIAYHKKHEYDRAILDYDHALKLKPDLALAYNTRGIAYEDKGRYLEALHDFEELLKLNPNDQRARQNRDRVAAKLQK
jgi:tetratricopeptide (TPR) repeat protein